MKTGLALIAMSACLRAGAMPVCPIDDFFPASNTRADIDSVVADPKPEIVHDDERLWFDYIEVGVRIQPGGPGIHEVTVLRNDNGRFRVSVLRARTGPGDGIPSPGVVDSRDLPATLAERLHRGVMPILARTHYAAPLVGREARITCMGGSWFFATVADLPGRYSELTGEARPAAGRQDSDVGSVQALGQALRDYALRRIDADGLEDPLKGVEARAEPGEGPMSTSR